MNNVAFHPAAWSMDHLWKTIMPNIKTTKHIFKTIIIIKESILHCSDEVDVSKGIVIPQSIRIIRSLDR